MHLQSNDFELLGLPRQFAQDGDVLAARWKALQAQVHPDRFANASDVEKRLAMQWSVRINEAYQRLRSPLQRAIYLCELQGRSIGAEDNTAMPAQFLMQQMEWLEALEEADSDAQVEVIAGQVQVQLDRTIEATAQALDQAQDAQAAVAHIRSWMFLRRFMERVQQRRQQFRNA